VTDIHEIRVISWIAKKVLPVLHGVIKCIKTATNIYYNCVSQDVLAYDIPLLQNTYSNVNSALNSVTLLKEFVFC
jgi:hypothetical protein